MQISGDISKAMTVGGTLVVLSNGGGKTNHMFPIGKEKRL